MKIKKNKKIFAGLTALGIAATSVLAACGPKNADEIIFATSQSQGYPMARTLTKVVKIYNDQQKESENFMPVKLLQTEENKIRSESGMITDVATKLHAKDYTSMPSVILSSVAAPAVINSYNKLLIVEDVLPQTTFADKILPLHTKIAGSSETKLFSLPFNESSTDSIVVNWPILVLLVKEMEKQGATVDTTAGSEGSIFKELKTKLSKTDLQTIPATKNWNKVEAKPVEEATTPVRSSSTKVLNEGEAQNNEGGGSGSSGSSGSQSETPTQPAAAEKKGTLKDYTINEATFKSWEGLSEFAKNAVSILKLKANKNVAATDVPSTVLTVDYSAQIFNKLLWNETGNTQDSFIYKYKTEINETPNIVDFAYKTSDDLKSKIKTAYGKFTKNQSATGYDSSLGIRAIHYNSNGAYSGWGAYDIREFDTAIAIAPNVGISASVQSNRSKAAFAKGADGNFDKARFDSFAKIDETVSWFNQLTQFSKDVSGNNKNVYIPGGSTLTAISVNEKKDKAVKNFLKWLYTGQYNDLHNNTKLVREFLEIDSGYFIPTAEQYGDVTKINAQIAKFETAKAAAKLLGDDLQFTYMTLIESLKDYKAFVEGSTGSNWTLFNPAQDGYTSEVNKAITSAFIASTASASDKYDEAGTNKPKEFKNTKLTEQEFLDKLLAVTTQ